MPPDPQKIDSDQDASSDEDFNPSGAISEPSSPDSSDAEEDSKPKPASKGRKRKRVTIEDAAAELDSGDEATIRERKKRLKKKSKKATEESEVSDEGGDGGFVKTRAQRRTEKEERKPVLARKLHTTVDVDSIWARLSSLPLGRPPTPPPSGAEPSQEAIKDDDEYITIKRRTKFAGQVTVESKRVHKDSAEAKIYLQEQAESKEKTPEPVPDGEEDEKPLNRPLKRTSRFEPNPIGEVKGLPPHLQLRWPRHSKAPLPLQPTRPGAPEAAKLNVVQKSRHDWAGFVDKQGIASELDEYGRSKANYLGREDFLNRTEVRLEEERRTARIANAAKPVRYAE